MAKLTLEFDTFEHADEIKHALNGGNYMAFMFEFDQEMRMKIKHGGLEGDTLKAWEDIRELYYQLLSNNDITLE